MNGKDYGTLDSILAILFLTFAVALMLVVGVGLGVSLWKMASVSGVFT